LLDYDEIPPDGGTPRLYLDYDTFTSGLLGASISQSGLEAYPESGYPWFRAHLRHQMSISAPKICHLAETELENALHALLAY
jgi:hypothetical protein